MSRNCSSKVLKAFKIERVFKYALLKKKTFFFILGTVYKDKGSFDFSKVHLFSILGTRTQHGPLKVITIASPNLTDKGDFDSK